MANSQTVETGSASTMVGPEGIFQVKEVVVHVTSGPQACVSFSSESAGPFTLVHIDFPEGSAGEYKLTVRLPFTDIQHTWAGMIDCWSGREQVSVGLNISFQTASNRFVPVICNYNRSGKNRYLVGLLNHLPLTTVTQSVDVAHPMRSLDVHFVRHRGAGAFRETLVLGRQPESFADVIGGYANLCRQRCSIDVLPAPAWTRLPVWCSWYAFVIEHAQQGIANQLPLAKELGFETILIDAPWLGRGSLFDICGDFVPDVRYFPDLKGLVRQIKDHGLRPVLWCAPLWVGKATRARQRMEKHLVLANGQRIDRLNPFTPESVEHAREVVGRLMSEYQLDGLKIDFMDHVKPATTDPEQNPDGRDFGDAMNDLMAAMRKAITRVNPQAMIEYRVRYSNLVSLAHANCHRGNDAPYDADYIRRENLFLRLLTDERSAVHSDYAYWHPDESLENVSLMLGQQVFSGGVPTVSVDLPTRNRPELDLIRHWLDFYRQHAHALANARLRVHSADSMLSVTSLEHAGQAFVLATGSSLPRQIRVADGTQQVWMLNATADPAGDVTLDNGGIPQVAKVTRWSDQPIVA